ncbi:zinc finger protein CONSTANS-LIKE 5 [Nicotiana sylvestris]|uniref:Zinc finger protein CONSTANS-LIKE 5-like n=1 Tax=Nicotiana sylvestris TaxID=4096 RepID=A0A1U7Y6K7_NICSY|nr:PREDICTED: zinc finger protein CONSTANS-LIKE 5-like [Nicotiana sylvestris]
MGILRGGANCFSGGWGAAAAVAKPCEYCHLDAALVFCRTDNMFMCLGCDTRVHGNARHERVWMCEVCEQAAASVTCKADAAALCLSCDRDIHSANPLAQRHERIPVVPFYDPVESVVKSTAATLLVSINNSNSTSMTTTTTTAIAPDFSKVTACLRHHEEDYKFDPWISPNTMTTKLPVNTMEMKPMDFLFSDSENILDFDYSVSIDTNSQPNYNSANDSVVPVQSTIKPLPFQHQEKHFEIDFTQSHIKSYTTPSLSHSVSSSSLDVGIVPDGSSISEISYPFVRSVNSIIEMGSSAPAEKLIGMNREARVLRYREKKKNRKFEKTIRYASRKAYAETRPRIKGRFAKRNDSDGAGVDSDIDQIFSGAGFIANDSRYGVVPSF